MNFNKLQKIKDQEKHGMDSEKVWTNKTVTKP